jgi:hypothetical protein
MLVQKPAKLRVGNLGLVDPEGVQGHGMNRLCGLVVLSPARPGIVSLYGDAGSHEVVDLGIAASHLERPRWDVDHHHPIGGTYPSIAERGISGSPGIGRRRSWRLRRG